MVVSRSQGPTLSSHCNYFISWLDYESNSVGAALRPYTMGSAIFKALPLAATLLPLSLAS